MHKRRVLPIFCLLLSIAVCTKSWAESPTMLSRGTPVFVQLEETVSSDTAYIGQKVHCRVAEDVTTDDNSVVLIRQGTPVDAEIRGVDTADYYKPGKVILAFTSTTDVNGHKIPLHGSKMQTGTGGAAPSDYVADAFTYRSTITLAISSAFRRGKSTKLNSGTRMLAQVDVDTETSDRQIANIVVPNRD